ncbi:MAG: asnC-type helix-turn-helix domain protein [Rhizobacter sp.]|nr:asnC-type helix-turn-helix domain protein [Rhizobacter sp.]
MKLDRIDIRLLEVLQHDCRMKSTELAEAVGLSLSPCYRRLRLMEEGGVIKSYVALVDPVQAGYPVDAYVSVAIDKRVAGAMDAFALEVAAYEEVMECFVVTGSFDFLLRVVAADVAGIDRFVTTKLPRLARVRDIHTSMPLRRVFSKTALPVKPTID